MTKHWYCLVVVRRAPPRRTVITSRSNARTITVTKKYVEVPQPTRKVFATCKEACTARDAWASKCMVRDFRFDWVNVAGPFPSKASAIGYRLRCALEVEPKS